VEITLIQNQDNLNITFGIRMDENDYN